MFPHRKPSAEAREAMQRSAAKLGMDYCCASNHREVNLAIKAVTQATGHRFAKLVASGDAAIMAVVKAINGRIMVPDQGAWRGFIDYPDLFGMETCTLKTNLGVIEPEILAQEIKSQKPKALFLTSFAGYIAEQNMEEISKICRENEVLLVEDASGAIGDARLAKARFADVIVASTGAPKIINLLTGGIISTNQREILDLSYEITTASKMNPVLCAGLVEELKQARRLIDTLTGYSRVLQEELKDSFKVVHPQRRGVCAGFLYNEPKKLAERARKAGLVTDLNQTFLTTCPLYERFLSNGIVVELKKLNVVDMHEDEILKIAEVLKKCA